MIVPEFAFLFSVANIGTGNNLFSRVQRPCPIGGFRGYVLSRHEIMRATLGRASVPPVQRTAPLPSASKQEPLHSYLALRDTHPMVIEVQSERCILSALACSQLVSRANISSATIPGGNPVVGFDCERSVRVSGAQPVAIIQVSVADGYTVVYRTKHEEITAGIVPKAQWELMATKNVRLASVRMPVSHEISSA